MNTCFTEKHLFILFISYYSLYDSSYDSLYYSSYLFIILITNCIKTLIFMDKYFNDFIYILPWIFFSIIWMDKITQPGSTNLNYGFMKLEELSPFIFMKVSCSSINIISPINLFLLSYSFVWLIPYSFTCCSTTPLILMTAVVCFITFGATSHETDKIQ